jgi:hypothetical protein
MNYKKMYQELARQALELRVSQRRYFRNFHPCDLQEAKKNERLLDELLRKHNQLELL